MGILGRINRVIKSNVNDLIDRMTDPAKEVDLLIIEMEGDLKKAREETVAATANTKRAEMRCAEIETEVERWQRRAEQAVRVGDDNLAREALNQKLTVETELETARRSALEQRAYVEQLTESLKSLDAKLKEVRLRKETLKQRARTAKEQQRGGGRAASFQKFEELEARIEAAEETQGIASSTRDLDLDAKFARLAQEQKALGTGTSSPVDDELAALKRRLSDGKTTK